MQRSQKKLQLPDGFAQKLLDNQIQFKLSQEPSNQLICNLVELYSMGVEYYESIKSYKYMYFKKKMNQLFNTDKKVFQDPQKKSQQKVEKNQDGESPMQKKMKSKDQSERIQALKFKQKQDKIQNEIKLFSNPKEEVKKIITSSTQKSLILQNKIKQQMQKQNQSIDQKIKQRRKRATLSAFSKSFSSFDLIETADTRQSLLENPKNFKERAQIEPLCVNFQNLIKQDESDQEDQPKTRRKSSFNVNGRIASMDNLHSQ